MDDRSRRAIKKRVFELVEVGYAGDAASRCYDVVNMAAVVVNLTFTVLDTFSGFHESMGTAVEAVETVTTLFFTADYILRLWTAEFLYPDLPRRKAAARYALSFTGLIDLLCFLPWYLPFFFPAGAVAFRMFRVIRILRLFRINAYYDSLNVIAEVLISKSQQLLSSVFIILVLMLSSSLCMYSLEHEAQPEVFSNAFSGIWWAASTLLTVGYGDIYPITPLGKVFGIFIAFLGVGIVAIPTGIISAGFVEQYSHIKRMNEVASEEDVQFIEICLQERDSWAGKTVRDLQLPRGILVAAIRRAGEVLVPRGDVELRPEDTLVLGAEPLRDDRQVDLQEVLLRTRHPWNGKAIRDLDISRQTFIVMVRRKKRILIPSGDLVLREGDTVILFAQKRVPDGEMLHRQ